MATEITYAIARSFVPVFNTPETPFKLPLVRKEDGRMMAMETVAFPGTLFTVKKQTGDIWEVSTQDYPSATPLYVDSRLLAPAQESIDRVKRLPSCDAILRMLLNLVGIRYFWGGNSEGIPPLLDLYEEPNAIPKEDLDDATCSGFDCSGLLYYATGGSTPRNTSELITYGEGIDIKGQTAEQICDKSKPLDLFVWRGHVVIFLSPKQIIESRIGKGVVITPAAERIEEAVKQLDAAGKPYYMRRWHPEQLGRIIS
jgi:cell wall-associated NlpC family hydrolase